MTWWWREGDRLHPEHPGNGETNAPFALQPYSMFFPYSLFSLRKHATTPLCVFAPTGIPFTPITVLV